MEKVKMKRNWMPEGQRLLNRWTKTHRNSPGELQREPGKFDENVKEILKELR